MQYLCCTYEIPNSQCSRHKQQYSMMNVLDNSTVGTLKIELRTCTHRELKTTHTKEQRD